MLTVYKLILARYQQYTSCVIIMHLLHILAVGWQYTSCVYQLDTRCRLTTVHLCYKLVELYASHKTETALLHAGYRLAILYLNTSFNLAVPWPRAGFITAPLAACRAGIT